MGVYVRKDSPFYWLLLERPGLRAIRQATKIPRHASSPQQAKENRRLADHAYYEEMAKLAKRRHGLITEPDSIRFATYAEWYRTNRTSAKSTGTREHSALARLIEHFGEYALADIDRVAVAEYLTARTKTDGVAPATANREVDVLKDMLTWAVPRYLSTNPLTGMRRLKGPRRGIRILSDDEESKICRVVRAGGEIEGLGSVEGYAFFVTAVDTFMRLGDLVALTPDQYHQTYIHVEDPKIEPYDVAVSERAREALNHLRRLTRQSRLIFPGFSGVGARAAENRAIRWFARVCQIADVPHGRAIRGVTFHSLRHTGATRFLANGGSLRDLMQQGGWSDLKSVLRYAHPSSELVEAVSRPARSRLNHAPTSGREKKPISTGLKRRA